jgi:transglutaminase-like putative cysteine protease
VLLAVFVLALSVLLAAASRPWSVPVRAAPVGRPELGGLRRLAAAVVVLAVLAGSAVVAGPALAGLVHRQPVDPRSYVVPPQKQLDQLNPLGMLAAWALDPKQDLLSVRTDRPERIQWATLSQFDGITWQPDRTYRAAGSVLPEPAATTDRTVTVRQRITIASLGGGWLPAVAAVREVHGVRVGYDAGSGTVLTPDGLSDGLAYDTVSLVPQQDPDSLSVATVPAGTDARYLTVPAGVPDGIVTLAQRTAGSGAPYRKALLLEHLLRTKYQYWSKAPSGNGYVTLKHFLLTKPAAGGARGTSEQFATSFALMARIVGLPTRVVVGFHAGQPTGSGRYRVTSGDAFAWPEVKLAGHGWVAFDPTPAAGKGTTPPDEDTPQAKSQQKQKSQQLDDAAPTPTPSAPVPSPSSSGRAAAAGASGPSAGVLGGSAAALLLVLVVAAVPVLRRRRTGRRLGTGGPAERVLGAWAEVRDTLRLAGARPADTLSAAEVAALAATGAVDRPGPPPPDLTPLARCVNAVSFAPSAGVPAEAAAASAALARDFGRAVRTRLGVLRRLLWHLDPRPLFWR